MAVNVKQLPIPSDLIKKLEKAGFRTLKDVIVTPPLSMQTSTGLTIQKTQQIYKKAYALGAPQPVKATELEREDLEQRLLFGLSRLDSFLNGGLSSGTLTEICGAPGSGKTQLCNLITLHTAAVKENGVAYIDTEGSFSAERLFQIGSHRYPEKLSNEENVREALSRIKVLRPKRLSELTVMLKSIDVFLVKNRCRLLIIDSVASLSRREFGKKRAVERASLLGRMASQLKTLADDLKMAVLITNHVTAPPRGKQNPQQSLVTALGPSWAHWVNSRIYLSRKTHFNEMQVVKSPELPEIVLRYRITPDGVRVLQ